MLVVGSCDNTLMRLFEELTSIYLKCHCGSGVATWTTRVWACQMVLRFDDINFVGLRHDVNKFWSINSLSDTHLSDGRQLGHTLPFAMKENRQLPRVEAIFLVPALQEMVGSVWNFCGEALFSIFIEFTAVH